LRDNRTFTRQAYVELDVAAMMDGQVFADFARDDLNDALAALWTAKRIVEGRERVSPKQPPVDCFRLRMEIVA